MAGSDAVTASIVGAVYLGAIVAVICCRGSRTL